MSKQSSYALSGAEMERFVSRFTEDAEFRNRCKVDARAALRELNIHVPGGDVVQIPEEYFKNPEILKRAISGRDSSCCH